MPKIEKLKSGNYRMVLNLGTVNGKQIEGNFLPADQLADTNEISITLG